MDGFAGIVLLQRHLVPPRGEELERMARALGGERGESLTLSRAGIVSARCPLWRFNQSGWAVTTGEGEPTPGGLLADPGAFLDALPGPFALAIRENGRLLLARDRRGTAPLYIAVARGRLCFATCVAALREALGRRIELDPVGLDQLFVLGAPVAPRTVFEGIEQVLPGSWLSVTGDEIVSRRFASLAFDAPLPVAPEPAAALQTEMAEIRATTLWRDPTESGTRAEARLLEAARRRGLTVLDAAGVAGSPPGEAELLGAVRSLESPLVDPGPMDEALAARRLGLGRTRVATSSGGGLVTGESPLIRELALRRAWARRPGSGWRPRLLDRLDPERLAGATSGWRQALYGAALDRPGDPFFGHAARWAMRSRVRALYRPAMRDVLPTDPADELRMALAPELEAWSAVQRTRHLEWTMGLGGRRPGAVLAAYGHAVELPWLAPGVVAAAGMQTPAAVLRAAPRTLQVRHDRRLAAWLRREAGQGSRSAGSPWVDPEWLAADGPFEPARVARLLDRLLAGCRLSAADHFALVVVISTAAWVNVCLHGAEKARAGGR